MKIKTFADSYLIPGVRVDYQQNLVGAKLSRLTFGLTLFGVAHLDLYSSVEKTGEAPRSAGVVLGFSEKF